MGLLPPPPPPPPPPPEVRWGRVLPVLPLLLLDLAVVYLLAVLFLHSELLRLLPLLILFEEDERRACLPQQSSRCPFWVGGGTGRGAGLARAGTQTVGESHILRGQPVFDAGELVGFLI